MDLVVTLNAGESRADYAGVGLVGRDRRALGPVRYQLAVVTPRTGPRRLFGVLQSVPPGAQLQVDGTFRLQLADGRLHVAVRFIATEHDAQSGEFSYQVIAAPKQAGQHNLMLLAAGAA